jgi:hypothetical protein
MHTVLAIKLHAIELMVFLLVITHIKHFCYYFVAIYFSVTKLTVYSCLKLIIEVDLLVILGQSFMVVHILTVILVVEVIRLLFKEELKVQPNLNFTLSED